MKTIVFFFFCRSSPIAPVTDALNSFPPSFCFLSHFPTALPTISFLFSSRASFTDFRMRTELSLNHQINESTPVLFYRHISLPPLPRPSLWNFSFIPSRCELPSFDLSNFRCELFRLRSSLPRAPETILLFSNWHFDLKKIFLGHRSVI